MKKTNVLLSLALLFSFAAPVSAKGIQDTGMNINLTHLNSLDQEVKIDGKDMLITHIYSEYPNYQWVDASGEGIACVDDVARATIVYLNDYEQTKNNDSLNKAKLALNFVMHMQAADGEFYNFINKDLSINKTGSTSQKSFDWWAARGMWALGYGYKVFNKIDPQYAKELNNSFLLANNALQKKVNPNYGKYSTIHGYQVPAWIDGFDAMSNALLGLSEYYSASPNPIVKDSMMKLGEGLTKFQFGSFDEYPFSAHLDWSGSPTLWHAWGSSQTFALAKAGQVLHKEQWIQSAKKEADYLFTHLLVNGMIKEMAPTMAKDEQIAYGVDMLVQGFSELSNVTHDKTYAKYAGIAASWFTGNNDAQFAMYDPNTGRGYDGINGVTKKVNMNSGAESTIETLMALQAIRTIPDAQKYLYSKTIERHTQSVLEAENFLPSQGNPQIIKPQSQWTGDASYSGDIVGLLPGDGLKTTIQSDKNEDVILYAAVEKKYLPEGNLFLDVYVNNKLVGSSNVADSNDTDYLTLIKVGKLATLNKGNNTVSVSLRGSQNKTVNLDNIIIQPAIESALFQTDNHKFIEIKRDFIHKKNSIIEYSKNAD
ncbi:glycoside hydrolase family protein [Neobacillus ginsengisoli]|uniref:Uncharacterized protein n=1 Tax=Neobacillus ginsengisoli TaxID=904295 RepID=A0ABT9XUL5_9BACI|nr:hypothetical protein [Neobacillus ginsengisoli]MDQ0199248.1 hypothetical protein [Neobacillus ginsengisoli]